MNNTDERDYAEERSNRHERDIEGIREALDELYQTYKLGFIGTNELNVGIREIKDDLPESVSMATFLSILQQVDKSDTSEERREWFFIGQTGWVWVVWHIMGIPAAEWDKSDLAHLPDIAEAPDGSAIWPALFLFRTKAEAEDFANNQDYSNMYDKTDIVDLTK